MAKIWRKICKNTIFNKSLLNHVGLGIIPGQYPVSCRNRWTGRCLPTERSQPTVRQGLCIPLINPVTTKTGLCRPSVCITLPVTVLWWLNFENEKGPNDPFRDLPFFADLQTQTWYPHLKKKGSPSCCRIYLIPTIPAFTASSLLLIIV